MASKDFTDYLHYSAAGYLQYVRTESKAKSLVGIRGRKKSNKVSSCLNLYLDKPVYSPENVDFVFINENDRTLISHNEYRVIGYDEKRRILGVMVFSDSSPLITAKIENLFIESDLSFLIKRYVDFYAQPYIEKCINVPPKPCIAEKDIQFSPSLSEEQRNAVTNALTSNVSYIWGAPGTGKTSKVLSDCIKNYVSAGKTVLVLAPTNNAVDQSLRGVLRSLTESGIPQSKVLRFGIPTLDFQNEYPDVCEDSVLQKRIESLITELKRLENLKQEVASLEKRIAKTDDFRKRFLLQYDAYIELVSLKNQAQSESETSEAAYKKAASEASDKHARLIETQNRLKAIKKEYSRPSVRIKTFFSRRLRRAYRSEISSLEDQATCFNDDYTFASVYLASSYDEKEKAQKKLLRQTAALENQKKSIRKMFPHTDKDLPLEDLIGVVDAEMALLHKQMNELLALSNGTSVEDRSAQLRDEIDSLQKIKLSEQKGVLVYASTIDTFVGRIPDFLKFEDQQNEQTIIQISHVFLDEAAYCPFAKSGPLFALNAPVTLLGDHMQLPPICEATAIYIKDHHEIALWEISSLFFPEAVYTAFDPDLYYDHYCNKKNIAALSDFPIEHSSALTQTYRFGDNLASILAGCVYADSFRGTNEDTAIYYLDVKADTTSMNENKLEAEAIAKYLSTHPKKDFAILTPFRAQRRMLVQAMPKHSERIMTIHASQGREFETVIISPVRMHLMTNSELMTGKQTLNTAISRSIKEIIICCSVKQWKTKDQQLIAKLLYAANPAE